MSLITRQIPPWLFLVLAAMGGLGALWLIGSIQPGPEMPVKSFQGQNIVAPEIIGTTLDGKPFRLSDLRGKVVLINFWATWCGPCREEIPELIEIQKKYASRGFTVIGIADDDAGKAAQFVQQSGIDYPVLAKPEGAAQAYGAFSLPTSVLIGRDGKFVSGMQGLYYGLPAKTVWETELNKIL